MTVKIKKNIAILTITLSLFCQFSFSQNLSNKARAKRDSIKNMSPDDKRKVTNDFTKLELSPIQIEKMKAIHAETKKARIEIEKDKSLSPEEKKKKLRALRMGQKDKVMNSLSTEQQGKFKEMGKDRMKKSKKDKE